MGVPKFYRWMSERYPLINQLISTAAVLPEFDNFYLDMNGIIHACSHPNSDFLANSLSVREMMLSIFRYIDRMVTEIVKPKKVLFMAIDGVAPRAKLNQQRARRFCSAEGRTDAINKAKERGEAVNEDNLFDSNCITPGTEFMETVSRHIKYFIRKKIKEDPLWRNLTIVFSGHDVPGEGEHKIMQFIRDLRADPNYEPNVRHCMYGQDADLIMLGLATHEPHFALLREVINFNTGFSGRKSAREVILRQSKDAQFQLLHLSILREYLWLDFGNDMPSAVDQERIIDDFIFLTFLVGNDFLPHLPTLDISEHAFDVLINAYRTLWQEKPGYIVDKGEIGEFDRLEALFQIVGSQELDILANREVEVKESNSRRRKHDRNLPTDDELEESEEQMQRAFEEALRVAMGGEPSELTANVEINNDVDEDLDPLVALSTATATASSKFASAEEAEAASQPRKNYRGRYYFEKFRVLAEGPTGEQFLTILMRNYLQGLLWCLAYYIKGCVSWTWYFPFHYGPLLQDMKNLSQLQSEISFELGQPFTPYQQLLGCLPPASSRLLPACYRFLMTNKDSPVLNFYPTEFKVDQDGKKNPWEAVVLLDFIDENKLLSAESELCPISRLTRIEVFRNHFGRILVYNFDPNCTETYLSCNPEIGLPDITRCMSVQQELPFSLSPGHYFAAELVVGTVVPIAGYPSLASLTLKEISLQAIKVNVFGSASRYKSLSIAVNSSNIESLTTQQAQTLLNRIVYVNYPHMHEARVVAVSTEVEEVRIVDKPSVIAALERNNSNKHPSITTVSADEGFLAERVVYDQFAAQQWAKDAAAEEGKYLAGRCLPGSGGVSIGAVKVRLRVRPLQGLQRDPSTGATKKIYAQSLEADIPIQLVLWQPLVKDERFAEMSELPLDELLPSGVSVVAVAGKLIGCKGTVLRTHSVISGLTKRRMVDAEFSLPQPEPPFGYALAKSLSDQFFSSKDLCQLLRISPSVLGKIVGSVPIKPGRVDLGLNLKKNGEYQLLGYSRRVTGRHGEIGQPGQRKVWQGIDTVQIVGMVDSSADSSNRAAEAEGAFWEYSAHAATLLCEFKARFPLLFQKLESLPHCPVYEASDLLGEQSSSYISAVMEWMKSQTFFSMPRTPFTTESLSRSVVIVVNISCRVHCVIFVFFSIGKQWWLLRERLMCTQL
jgi:5'-3' exoribonuclease 1